jgi:hypothetical protein
MRPRGWGIGSHENKSSEIRGRRLLEVVQHPALNDFVATILEAADILERSGFGRSS